VVEHASFDATHGEESQGIDSVCTTTRARKSALMFMTHLSVRIEIVLTAA
jgi:hypothetical protein